METVSCNLCRSERHAVLHDGLPDLLLGRDGVAATFVRCRRCGLVYQNPRPTFAEMAAHYPPEYDSYDVPADGSGAALMRRAVSYGVAKRCRFLTRHKRPGRVLDVGCATGTFLEGMQQAGWEAHGVDISEYAAGVARRRLGAEVRVGTLEAAAYPDRYFDAVTLWDVLEHLHDPVASLREVHRVLKDDGLLVVRVPDGSSWDARLFGRHWAGLDAPRHLYVYDPATAGATLARSGFRVLSRRCGLGGYPTFVLSLRFRLKGQGASPRVVAAAARVLGHPLARLASAPAFFVADRLRRGPLMVITAVKAGGGAGD